MHDIINFKIHRFGGDTLFLPSKWKSEIKNVIIAQDGMSPAEVFKGKLYNNTIYIKSIDERYTNTTYSVKREAQAMQWLKNQLLVPQVIDYGCEKNKEYLLMSELTGKHIDDYRCEPEAYVMHLVNCIKILQSIDIKNCPFDSTIEFRLTELKFLLENGLADVNKENWEKTIQSDNPNELFNWLYNNRPDQQLVFTHGDISANIIIKDDKYYFYDLARVGLADKWLDIAFCVRDIRDIDIGSKYEDLFFKLLDIKPDYQKINYFILLDEMF